MKVNQSHHIKQILKTSTWTYTLRHLKNDITSDLATNGSLLFISHFPLAQSMVPYEWMPIGAEWKNVLP